MINDKVLQISDIRTIRRVKHYFVIHLSVYAPLFIIQLLRLVQQRCQTIDCLNHIVRHASLHQLCKTAVDQLSKPRITPHTVYPLLCLSIAHISHKFIDVALNTLIVVVCYVVIPKRSPVKQRVLLVLIEIRAVITVDISTDLRTDKPVCQRGGIDPATIALICVQIVIAIQNCFKITHIVAYVSVLLRHNLIFVRIMNANRHLRL